MPRLRTVLVLVLLAVLVWGTTAAMLEALRPVESSQPVTSVQSGTAVSSRLAQHVLLVVVDGLRWDIARSPKIMPRFAAAMQRHTSAAIWANPISMTSSAVLAYGTGERASLDQVLENLHLPTARLNSWLQNAQAAGLTLAAAGDPAWAQLYGQYLTSFRPDPRGIAIARDFNTQTFGNARELQRTAPDFLVVHFVTPDHQGHAYGVRSDRYRAHLQRFDRDLFAWLDTLAPDWTVVVTSDHGAAESGTHGTDTTEQRQCPIFAYGPGIQSAVHLQRRLDQVELTGLFAALLGVPNAEQSRGATLVEWLDVNAATRHGYACAEISRFATIDGQHRDWYAAALDCCAEGTSRRDCSAEARNSASTYDRYRGSHQGIQSRRAWPWLGVVLAAALTSAFLLWGKQALSIAAGLSAWLSCSLGLTLCVERLPGIWPNTVRASLFTAVNVLLLLGALGFKRWVGKLELHPALTLSVFPGWLLVSYSTNTQVESYCTLWVLAALLSWQGFRKQTEGSRDTCSSLPSTRANFTPEDFPDAGVKGRLASKDFGCSTTSVVLVVALGLLALAGTKPSDIRPLFFLKHSISGSVLAGSTLLAGLLWAVLSTRTRDPVIGVATDQPRPATDLYRWWAIISLPAMVMVCFILQHTSIHWSGRAAWLVTVVGALACLHFRRIESAILWGIASYACVARDYEWLIVVPALVVADIVSKFSSSTFSSTHGSRTVLGAVHVTFLFALGTLLRIGLQGGLQLETLDFTAGTFGDHTLPLWLSATLLCYKFLAAQLLLLGVYLRHFPVPLRRALLLGLVAAHGVRCVSLLLMLFVCGHSYWTAFRVVADLPFALVGVLGGVIAIGGMRLLSLRLP